MSDMEAGARAMVWAAVAVVIIAVGAAVGLTLLLVSAVGG